MLELGRTGSMGVPKGVVPVLRDGAVVAAMRASGWRESAFVVIGQREWVFAKRRGELSARWAADEESSARFRARQTSFWRTTWSLDLAGTAVTVQPASIWKGTHRALVDGRVVAESGSAGGWGQRPTLTVPAGSPLSLEAQVFLLWLESILRHRAGSAAAGGTVAATGAIG